MPVYPPIPGKTPFWTYAFSADGVRFRGSTKATTKREAEAVERRLIAKAEAQTRAGNRATLDTILARYWQEHAQHLPSADTVWYQLERLQDGLGRDARGRDRVAADIDGASIAAYVARRRGQPTSRGTLPANATINREIQLLRRVLRRAKRVWGMDIGPERNWQDLILPEAQERIRALSLEEEDRLFAALRQDMHALLRFSLITGVRLASAIGLTWADIDWQGGTIRFRGKSRRPGGQIHTLPITPDMLAILSAEQGHHPIYVFTYECKRSRAKRRRGERYPFTQSGWRKAWAVALDEAGVADFRWHDARHTAATRLVARTGNLKLAQRMLGHADITTTAKYAHASMDDLASAMISVSESVSELRSRNGKKVRNIK